MERSAVTVDDNPLGNFLEKQVEDPIAPSHAERSLPSPPPLNLNYSTFESEHPAVSGVATVDAAEELLISEYQQDMEGEDGNNARERDRNGYWKESLTMILLWVVALPLLFAALYICLDLLRR